MTEAAQGPHQAIAADSPQEQLLAQLLDALWDRYRQRVSYVADYERVIRAAGATFVNDHVAFRTFALQDPPAGSFNVARIFEAFGYRAAGNYDFADKHLSATHYQHPNGQFPKLFVSELRVWELPAEAREIIVRTTGSHRASIGGDRLAAIAELAAAPGSTSTSNPLLPRLLQVFHELPWRLPQRSDVLALNHFTQYGAWVLAHGYNVNHFTSLVNSHGVDRLNTLEGTIKALQAAGVPMKNEIEGQPGSKLRQTATEAAKLEVDVLDDGAPTKLPWTYAYFELAERNNIPDPTTGEQVRFEGFLGPQATNLFEMTRVR